MWLVFDKDGHAVKVSEQWIYNDMSIPLICYNEAKDRYKLGDPTSVIIPPGSCNVLLSEEGSGNLPPLLYRNKPGEHKCLENSFMSAMLLIGFPEVGKRMSDLSVVVETTDTKVCGSHFLQDVANKILQQFDMKPVKKKTEQV